MGSRRHPRPRSVNGGGLFRLRDLDQQGLGLGELRRRLRTGEIERLARGLYRHGAADLTENHTLAVVAARVPQAIFCLLTALRVHGLTTQLPHEAWIALPNKARAPRLPEVKLRVVRFSGATLREGVEPIEFEGVPTRITSPARTVVDCFRFRNKIGIDVAVEALRDFSRRYRGGANELSRMARICRVSRVMQPYLDSIA